MLKYVFIAILRLPIVVTPLLRASMKIPWLGKWDIGSQRHDVISSFIRRAASLLLFKSMFWVS